MEFRITATIAQLRRELSDVEKRQLPFAGVVAATRTARTVRTRLVEHMQAIFDRPTRWTLNSLKVEPATPADPIATVGWREFASKGTAAGKYIRRNIEGGDRRNTRFEGLLRQGGVLGGGEFLVPARGVPLDAHGNLSRGLYSKIASQLKVSRDPAQNETPRSRRRQRRRGGSRFFMPKPGSGLPRGVYERKAGERGISGVMMAVRQPRYRAIFDFLGLADKIASAEYPEIFWQALRDSVKTSNFRGRWK